MRLSAIIEQFVEDVSKAIRAELETEIREQVRAEFLRALDGAGAKRKPKPVTKRTPRAVTCGKCGKAGHNARTCPSRRGARPSPAVVTVSAAMPAKDRRSAILQRAAAREAAAS